MKQIIFISARSFGRELFSLFSQCIAELGDCQMKGFLDDDSSVLNGFDNYPPIIGSVDNYTIQENDRFVCAIGDPIAKFQFIQTIKDRGGKFINLIHPTSIIGLNVKLGEGLIIGPYSYIGNDSKIGDFVTVQSHVAIGHDVVMGDFIQVNAFAFMGGYVKIGNNVSIHPGSNIAPKIKVEDNAIIGINSAVIRNVKEYSTVFGVPAKKVLY